MSYDKFATSNHLLLIYSCTINSALCASTSSVVMLSYFTTSGVVHIPVSFAALSYNENSLVSFCVSILNSFSKPSLE